MTNAERCDGPLMFLAGTLLRNSAARDPCEIPTTRDATRPQHPRTRDTFAPKPQLPVINGK